MIETTGQLCSIAEPVLGRERVKKDMAKVFQALRMEVNHETEALQEMLQSAASLLRSGGTIRRKAEKIYIFPVPKISRSGIPAKLEPITIRASGVVALPREEQSSDTTDGTFTRNRISSIAATADTVPPLIIDFQENFFITFPVSIAGPIENTAMLKGILSIAI